MTGFRVYETYTKRDHFANPPRRRAGGLGLLRGDGGRVALTERETVDHSGSQYYNIGGCVEQNESVLAALVRHARAKIGLEVTPGRLLVVQHGPEVVRQSRKTGTAFTSAEGTNDIFDLGVISEDTEFKVGGNTIAVVWFARDELAARLSAFTAWRTVAALDAVETGGTAFLEGHPPQ